MTSSHMEKHRVKMDQRVCRYLPKRTKTMYDIGVGPKLEWFRISKKNPDMIIFGCEPDPRTFESLKKSFCGTLWPIAIAKDKKKLTLNLFESHKLSSALDVNYPDRIGSVKVDCWTLDYFDMMCGQPEGILLWMDIEGMELEALQSGENLLNSGRVDTINLEVRDQPYASGWPTATEIDKYLTNFGFELVESYNDQHTHWDVIYLRKQS